MTQIKINLPPIIKTISNELSKLNYRAILVGGCVRDFFLELPIKDYDIEVFGIENIEVLESILSQFGTVNLVGKSFGILKFRYGKHEYDFSLPRLELKTGEGHKGFGVTCDSSLDFKSAAIRRDFTINAIGYDIENNEVLDPFGGLEDIKKRVLKAVNPSTFIEDPLRAYRATQFCARFDFKLDDETLKLCQEIALRDEFVSLPKERVYNEFRKIFLFSQKPSIGFEVMRKIGIIRYFPELESIIGIPQDPIYHPEGDVWTHTMMVIDEMSKLKCGSEKIDLKLFFAALCHDFGKATHTQISPEKISAIGHENASVEMAKTFLYRLTNEHKFIKSILPFIRYHTAPLIYFRNHAKDKTIIALSTKVNISELVILARADFFGRTTKEAKHRIFEAGDWLLKKAKELGVENSPPKPFVMGRDLINIGLTPSSDFQILLHKIYAKQLSGELKSKDDALVYLSKIINL